MEKISISKKQYTIFADESLRGFMACSKQLRADMQKAEAAAEAEAAGSAATEAAEAAKAAAKRAKDMQRAAAKDTTKAAEAKAAAAEAEAAKQAAEAAAKRSAEAQAAAEAVRKECANNPKQAAAIAGLLRVMQQKQLRAADICKDFLLQYLPQRFNAAQQICTIKQIVAEAEAEAREAYKNTPQMLEERSGILCVCKPVALFTANTFLSLFCSAAEARKKERKENLSAAEKQAKAAKAAEAEAKRIEAYKAKIAAYEAKPQKAAAAEAAAA